MTTSRAAGKSPGAVGRAGRRHDANLAAAVGCSVGVVAYEMEGRPTGVGRYVEELLAALQRTSPTRRWTLRLFFRGDPFAHPLWTGTVAGNCLCEPIFDRRPGAHPILWEQFRLPMLLRRERPDIVFSPGYSLPRTSGRPSLVTIHDLSFEHRPGDFGLRERWRRRLLARSAARSASRILTDTGRTARELERRYAVPAERISVAPLGVSPRFEQAGGCRCPPGREQALARLGVRTPYLLVPGSVLPRRRLDLVLAALRRLLRDPMPTGLEEGAETSKLEELQVVVAGRNRLPRREELQQLIGESGCAERVHRLGYVDDGILPDLYAGAAATAYVSEYEGYGLPPLESLAAGVPVLVSDAPALLELWPDYPLRCDVSDVDTVTDGLRRLLFDRGARAAAAAEGAKRVRSLTWVRAAEQFAIELERVWRTAGKGQPS